MINVGSKHQLPDAVLDYTLDWSAWLEASDTISASDWTLPEGLRMTDSTHGTTTATVWLTGGTSGEKYIVVNRVTTALGRTDSRAFTLVID